MKNTKQRTKAAKAREQWRLLQEEQKTRQRRINSEEKTIPLKVAHKRSNSNVSRADSA